MELSGRVKKLMESQTFNSGFRKRELILLTQEQYPQTISVEFLQDKIDLLNDVHPDDEVKISINIRGREWTNPEGVTKYFNSITGWRIEKIGGNTAAETPPPADFNAEFADLSKDSDKEVDDLPF